MLHSKNVDYNVGKVAGAQPQLSLEEGQVSCMATMMGTGGFIASRSLELRVRSRARIILLAPISL